MAFVSTMQAYAGKLPDVPNVATAMPRAKTKTCIYRELIILTGNILKRLITETVLNE